MLQEPNPASKLPTGIQLEQTESGLSLLHIANPWGTARILTQGAQLLDWIPTCSQPVVWLSPFARFTPGKSARGGIPICWPWFGPHDSNPAMSAHGPVRAVEWTLADATTLPDGSHRLDFRLPSGNIDPQAWSHHTSLRLIITLGTDLKLELGTHNHSNETLVLGEALHTYFYVSDVRHSRVLGLEDEEYLDKVDNGHRKRQAGPIVVTGETDRVYLNTTQDCVIEDAGIKRRIRISKEGSHSTIIWNPWIEKAARLGDMGDNGYLEMLCVESGNAAENRAHLAPGEEHWLKVRYSVEAME
jgi:glucose-6-phosphate 1-epimerase